ncbi:hypothetical protein [Pseudogulbenkiania ferrooxidans]|uniref:Uncharacterized protein n=1 Tax=Pseudogulbenkiania ferrooxidans 2002 TaxID=279714 RepID=B9Z310_9NEIS|nr:hypothetical protein [Pseudogulbenkiania ferrooxidans]EEG08963.1 hypothetical protein FuraDRAFT_1723 [Pseudogulbenkiania ferrooxidans 2002]
MKHLSLITEKLKEADFFLERMVAAGLHVEELNYYFSAFASAARSVTFVLQYVGSAIGEEFDKWYEPTQARLRGDKVAKYLLEARNEALKTGAQPISYGQRVKQPNGEETVIHFFSYIGSEAPAEVPSMDVFSACRHQMTNLTGLVAEFLGRFEAEVWDESRERQVFSMQLDEVKSIVLGGDIPDGLWQKVIGHIESDSFHPPKPSETIRSLVAKYGNPSVQDGCGA